MLAASSFSMTITNTCEKLGTTPDGEGVGGGVGVDVGVGTGVVAGVGVGVALAVGVGRGRWCFCQPGAALWPCASTLRVASDRPPRRSVETTAVRASVRFI